MANIVNKVQRIAIGGQQNYSYVKRENSITTMRFSERKFDLVDANEEFADTILESYDELKTATEAFKIHGRTALIKQMGVEDCEKYDVFINETIRKARTIIFDVLKSSDVDGKGKVLCAITCFGLFMIRTAWRVYDRIKQ